MNLIDEWPEVLRDATMLKMTAYDDHGEIMSTELRGRLLDQVRREVQRIYEAESASAKGAKP